MGAKKRHAQLTLLLLQPLYFCHHQQCMCMRVQPHLCMHYYVACKIKEEGREKKSIIIINRDKQTKNVEQNGGTRVWGCRYAISYM